MRLLKFVVAPLLIILALAFAPEIFPDHGVLYEAISKGDLQRLRTLLDRGADLNVRYTFQSGLRKPGRRASRFGWNEQPLLLYALSYNHVDMAKLLLERGANPNVTDTYGNTALWHAVPLGDASLVRLFLAKGADPLAVMPGDGSTALADAPEPPPELAAEDRDDPVSQQMLKEKSSQPRYRTTNPEIIRVLQDAAVKRKGNR